MKGTRVPIKYFLPDNTKKMTAPLICKNLFFNLLLTLSFAMGGMSLFSQVRFEKSYPMMNETTGFGVALALDEGYLSCGTLYSRPWIPILQRPMTRGMSYRLPNP